MYIDGLQDLIRTTAGAELCASHLNPMPNASDCAMAYDETYKGPVDLSQQVTVGEPIKKAALRWSVPYNVKDAAGNAAATVWRDVVVEEVELGDMEAKIREEMQQQQKSIIQKAVDKAVEEDRRKRERAVSSHDRKASIKTVTCPDCPKCDCLDNSKLDEATCNANCDARIKQCAIGDKSYVIRAMLWLERMLPLSMVPIVLACAVTAVCFLMLRWTLTLIINPQAFRRGYYDDVERERAMLNAVVYHHPEGAFARNGLSAAAMPPPPQASLSTQNGYFSPHLNNNDYPLVAPFRSPVERGQTTPMGEDYVDIYQSPSNNSIITPSKAGDGVRRRSPYAANSRSSM